MRKKILFFCIILTSQLFSQNVVYLKNGSIIKGKVLEQVWGGNVKLETSDGSIFVFEGTDIERVESVKEEDISETDNMTQIIENTPQKIEVSSLTGNMYIEGQKKSLKEMLRLTDKVCPQAYNDFKKCKKMSNASIGLTVFGGISVIAGTALLVTDLSEPYSYTYSNENSKLNSGISFLTIGAVSLISSLAIALSANNKYDKAVNTYNHQCVKSKMTSEVRLNIHPNGVGVSLNF